LFSLRAIKKKFLDFCKCFPAPAVVMQGPGISLIDRISQIGILGMPFKIVITDGKVFYCSLSIIPVVKQKSGIVL